VVLNDFAMCSKGTASLEMPQRRLKRYIDLRQC
jgi:hypothetical protein